METASSKPRVPHPDVTRYTPSPACLEMIAGLRQLGIHSEEVLEAFSRVPRELFLSEALWARAYENNALPIGHGQTISQPYIVALMIESVLPPNGRLEKVLDVGTGCGYQAALLSYISQEVYTIERIRPLYDMAGRHLSQLHILNVRRMLGDGYEGMPLEAPFDAIVVAAVAPEIPKSLLQQLKLGGKMVIPLGNDELQVLTLCDKRVAGVIKTPLEEVRFVPMLEGIVQ